MNKQTFVNNLLIGLKAAGFNTGWGIRQRVAKRYKVTPQAVSEWLNVERGNYPKLEILEKMSQDLQMSIDELVFGNRRLPDLTLPSSPDQIAIFSFEKIKKEDIVLPFMI